jgi:hypothetical protein
MAKNNPKRGLDEQLLEGGGSGAGGFSSAKRGLSLEAQASKNAAKNKTNTVTELEKLDRQMELKRELTTIKAKPERQAAERNAVVSTEGGIKKTEYPYAGANEFKKGGMTASSRTKDKDKNEDENKEFSRGKRALGAAMAVPGAITGATLLGTQPDFPVYDSAKYGAKLMLAKNKREEREAGEELESAVKLRKSQKRQADTGEKTNPMGDTYKKGGMTASSRADGCAVKGKTKGRFV